MKYDDQDLDANVAKWDVKVLALSRKQRHLDGVLAKKVWDVVEKAAQTRVKKK